MRLSAPSTKRTARPAAIVSTKSATTALARAVARAATTGMMRKAAAALAAAMALRAAARRSGRIPARGGLSSTIRNRICRHAWVAACAIVGAGVTLGEGAVLGGGAVTFKDLAPWTVYVGNPAREIRKRKKRRMETPYDDQR